MTIVIVHVLHELSIRSHYSRFHLQFDLNLHCRLSLYEAMDRFVVYWMFLFCCRCFCGFFYLGAYSTISPFYSHKYICLLSMLDKHDNLFGMVCTSAALHWWANVTHTTLSYYNWFTRDYVFLVNMACTIMRTLYFNNFNVSFLVCFSI